MSEQIDPILTSEEVRSLPFVMVDEGAGELCFWDTAGIAEGCGPEDIALGEQFALAALEISRRLDMPRLIAAILGHITIAGKITGVEAGFLATIASAAHVGSHS